MNVTKLFIFCNKFCGCAMKKAALNCITTNASFMHHSIILVINIRNNNNNKCLSKAWLIAVADVVE